MKRGTKLSTVDHFAFAVVQLFAHFRAPTLVHNTRFSASGFNYTSHPRHHHRHHRHHHCVVDRFTKTFFWNFQSIPADICYILIYKQMLEKVFCSNITPSLSSGNHLFYKAEYMGQSCPNQVWAITFDWSALAT